MRDALISFKGEVWLEAELDLMFDPASHPNSGGLTVTPKFLVANQPIQFNASTRRGSGTSRIPLPGRLGYRAGECLPAAEVTGGIPPYTYDVEFTPTAGSPVAMWDKDHRTRRISATFPPTTNETGTLVITVTDSTSGTAAQIHEHACDNVAGPTQRALPNGAPADTAVNASIPPATFACGCTACRNS